MKRAFQISTIALLTLAAMGCQRAPRWNVLLVTFDTTRADRIGCYGYDRGSTPNLDALAAEGYRFEKAMAAVPITLPSHSTILTGQYPLAHGVRDNGLFRLADRQVTLAEILGDAGYTSGAAVASFPLATGFGVEQGFDLFDDHFAVAFEDFLGQRTVPKRGLYFDERPASLVNDALVPWLEANHERPFFAWAHYFDPHQPFAPPPPYDQLFADDLYDGEIAYADEALGALIDRLKALGVWDRTVVVVTADHGEGLGEHNELTHSTLAYNTTLHVPLVVRIPGPDGGVAIPQRVGTVDIVPTLLDLLGIDSGEEFQGQSLRPLIDSRGAHVAGFPRPQYAETLSPRIAHDLGELRVLFARQLKYIHGPRPELYDIEADPREQRDLVVERAEDAAAMERQLATFLTRHVRNEPDAVAEMDAETRARLEALGYIQSRAGEMPTLVETLRTDGTPPQDQVDDVNEQSTAKQLLYEQRPLAAKRMIELLLGRHPENATYLTLRARAEIGLGQVDQAVATLDEVRRLNPQALPDETAMVQVANHLFAKGDAVRALTMIEAQQEVAPGAFGQWMLASLYAALGRRDEEHTALERSLELTPTFAPARVDLAARAAQAGDFATAENEFTRALHDMPYYARGHYNFGAMLLERDRPDEALTSLRRATEIDPGYVQGHYAVVATAHALGRFEEAKVALDALRTLAPTSPQTEAATALLEGAP